MARTILMTGGSGFIGRALTRELERQGFNVSIPEDPLEDEDAWRQSFAQANWHSIIHLAAMSSVGDCEANPALATQINVNYTEMVSALALQFCPKAQFIFPSTAQVYANSPDALSETSLTAPQTVYSKSKLAAETALRKAADRGLKTTILRIFNHTHKTQQPVFFMPSVYQQLLTMKQSSAFTLKVGNIDVFRDIGAVADLVSAITLLINQDTEHGSFEIFNICSGERRLTEEFDYAVRGRSSGRIRNGNGSGTLSFKRA